jgi:hypothetical protein
MDSIVREDIQRLAAAEGGPHVSLYMPTHRAVKYNGQDPLQFRNMLKRAAVLLDESGLRGGETDDFLRPAASLLMDQKFWQNLSDGFAVFVGGNGLITYFRLPMPFEPLVHVGQRYHIRPLLPLFAEDGRFFILALSQGEVRLLQGTRHSVNEIELRHVVPSLKAHMKLEEYVHLQRHQRTSSGSVTGGRGDVVFHGEGVGMDDRKDDILHYFQHLDKGLHGYLRTENAPLVLAGVDYLMPLYRHANTYVNLIAETIPGNPEGLSARALHARAWEVVKPYFQQDRREALAAFMHLYSTDRGKTLTDIAAILPAVEAGRVCVLFLAPGARQWGHYNPCTNAVTSHAAEEAGDDDLYDLAVARTILKNGKVFFLESADQLPGAAPAAAILRY